MGGCSSKQADVVSEQIQIEEVGVTHQHPHGCQSVLLHKTSPDMKLGVRLVDDGKSSVRIFHLEPHSPLASLIGVGDALISINGERCCSGSGDAADALKQAKDKLNLEVQRATPSQRLMLEASYQKEMASTHNTDASISFASTAPLAALSAAQGLDNIPTTTCTSSDGMASSIYGDEDCDLSQRRVLKMRKASELLKVWELDPEELNLSGAEKIGEGGQATVLKSRFRGATDIAIKQARMRYQFTGSGKARQSEKQAKLAQQELEKMTQTIRREVRALARVRHPNVVRLYGACLEPTPMVVMAYAPLGTLQDVLEEAEMFTQSAQIVKLLAGVARGMEAVHAHNIIHFDLKPENVLIGSSGVPWVTDFGLSTSSNIDSISKSMAGGRGTLAFMPPELHDHPPVISKAIDVYAFSILGWCVVSREFPFANLESASTSLGPAVRKGVRPTLMSGEDWRSKTLTTIADLIEACWSLEITQRPKFEDCVHILEEAEMSTGNDDPDELQFSLVSRLMTCKHDLQRHDDMINEIDEATQMASPSEAKELQDEKEGYVLSSAIIEKNAERTHNDLLKLENGDQLASAMDKMLQMMLKMQRSMDILQGDVSSISISLSSMAVAELDCPRLVVLIPIHADSQSSRIKRLLHRSKSFLKDLYRLVFLDPVSGCATRTGPEGDGYRLELPSRWLVKHAQHLSDGLKVAKFAIKAGRMCGLPLDVDGLPAEVVGQHELQALRNFEMIVGEQQQNIMSSDIKAESPKSPNAATGQSYRALKNLIAEQCKDPDLLYCEMSKVRANDGSVEFVSDESKEKFIVEGQKSLIWNSLNSNPQ